MRQEEHGDEAFSRPRCGGRKLHAHDTRRGACPASPRAREAPRHLPAPTPAPAAPPPPDREEPEAWLSHLSARTHTPPRTRVHVRVHTHAYAPTARPGG